MLRKKHGIVRKSIPTEEREELLLEFKMLPITKNIDEELANLNAKYRPLNDKVIIKARQYMQYENDSIYYGELNSVTNEKHGRGIFILPNGTKYEGYFRNNRACVYGKLAFANGDIYEGEFFKGRYSGFGNYVSHTGDNYSGQFKDDLKDGQGREINADGTVYIGDFCKGEKHGTGKIVYPNLDEFEGDFCDGKVAGKGRFYWAEDKTQFICDYNDNNLNGEGNFIWPSEKQFVGKFDEKQMKDMGAFTWNFGVRYKCRWTNGEPNHDLGEFYDPEDKKWRKTNDKSFIETRDTKESNKKEDKKDKISPYKHKHQADISNTSTSDFKITTR